MATSYTSSLRLALPVTGELNGTWGDVVNQQITSLVDQAVAGFQSVVITGNYTLSTTNGAVDESRNMMLKFTGTLAADVNVVVPTANKLYFIHNATTGGFAITVKTSAGTGVTIANGLKMVVCCDGTNVVDAVTSLASPTISGNVTLNSGTANQVQFLNASKVLSGSTNLTFDGTTLTAAGFSGPISGNASSATKLATARTIWGQSFDGTANVSGAITGATDITASGNVTLSGGTANGVAYLNGSKVLTTGGALTFDGSTFNVSGASRVSGGAGMFIQGTLAGGSPFLTGGALELGADSTAATIQAFTRNGLTAYDLKYNTTTNHIWSLASSEQMRLTSTGLGIGTSSPGAKLDVNGTMGVSGAVTLSGGTANGVPYLNGSKVLTSGSALTFDGANFTVSNAGTQGFEVRPNSGDYVGGINLFSYNRNTSAWSPMGQFASYFAWQVNASEAMRLDASGNLGIGTSSPGYKLDVVGNIRGSGFILSTANSGNGYISPQSASACNIGTDNGSLQLVAGTVGVAATINTSGNLGLGVTPSGWNSTFKAIEIVARGNAILSYTGGGTIISSNAYFDSVGWKYGSNGFATNYDGSAGRHVWYTAPSGTAGAAISFTQAMTLDASGNLGIGTTSPGNKLVIEKGDASNVYLEAKNNTITTFFGAAGTSFGAVGTVTNHALAFYTNTAERARIDASGNLGIGVSPSQKLQVAGNGLFMSTEPFIAVRDSSVANKTWYYQAMSDGSTRIYNGSDGVEAARFTSTGNLGLGATPSAWGSAYKALQINGRSSVSSSNGNILSMNSDCYYNGTNWIYSSTGGGVSQYTVWNGSHIWNNAPAGTAGNPITFTQAMTLDASGNLLVGTTSSSDGSLFKTSASFTALNAYRASTTVGNTIFSAFSDIGGTQTIRAAFRADGGLANYSGNNVNLSDERTKTNISLAGGYLDKICAIPVKLFNFKDESDGERRTLGVIAQDVEIVAPELVSQDGWIGESPEGETPLKSIYTTDMMFAMMKAIQELKASLDEVKLDFDAYKAAHP